MLTPAVQLRHLGLVLQTPRLTTLPLPLLVESCLVNTERELEQEVGTLSSICLFGTACGGNEEL